MRINFLNHTPDHPADVAAQIRQNPYPILFVLQGELEVRFRTDRNLIKQGHFAVVASSHLVDCRLSPSLVMMLFYPPERLAFYLGMSSKSFRLSISEILPIRPSLQGWIDEQLKQVSAGSSLVENSHAHGNDRARCLELVRILMAYPRDSINTLFMPLYACSIGNCRKCTEGL